MTDVDLPGGEELSRLYIERQLVPTEPHDGFSERHGQLVEQVRDRLLGSVATLGQMDDTDPTQVGQRINDIYTLANTEHKGQMTTYRAAVALDNYLHNTQWQYRGERKEPHQREVLHDVLGMLGQGKKEGHVELATSLGKTYDMAKLAEAFNEAGLRVLMLAPTVTIARQIMGSADAGGDRKGLARFTRRIDNSTIGTQFGGKKAKPEDQVVVSTYQSLNSFATSGELGQFDVILADEAHRGLGEITKGNLETFSPHAVKIGFTATPDFSENKSVKEIFPEKIHSIDLREAVDEGLTAPVHALVLRTGEEIPIKDENRKDFSDRELRRLIDLKSRNEQAIKFAKDFVNDGRQGIISCVPGGRLAHARVMAQRLSEEEITDRETGETRKIIAKAVGSFMSPDEQEKILEQYEAGKIDILTYVDALGEGWDSQKASFLISLRPTTSIVQKKQEIGRVIRKKADGTVSIVVDFVDEVIGKEQQTALHALGEEEINMGKFYGRQYIGDAARRPDFATYVPRSYLRGMLQPELYEALAAMDGKLLSELKIPKAGRQYRKDFERKLEKAGLYPDTHLAGIKQEVIDAIQDFRDAFLNEFHREPTDDEICAVTSNLDSHPNSPVQRLVKSQTFVSKIKAGEAIRQALHLMEIESIDALGEPYGDDIDASDAMRLAILLEDIEALDETEQAVGEEISELANTPGYDSYKDPEDAALRTWEREYDIPEMMAHLDQRDRDILIERFGLHGGPDKTLEEVGASLAKPITRERVRALETQALSSIRAMIQRRREEYVRRERSRTNFTTLLTPEEFQVLLPHEQEAYRAATQISAEQAKRYIDRRDELIEQVNQYLNISDRERELGISSHEAVNGQLRKFFQTTRVDSYPAREHVVSMLMTKLAEHQTEHGDRSVTTDRHTQHASAAIDEFSRTWMWNNLMRLMAK